MKANGLGITRNHRVGLSAAYGHRLFLSLACKVRDWRGGKSLF